MVKKTGLAPIIIIGRQAFFGSTHQVTVDRPHLSCCCCPRRGVYCRCKTTRRTRRQQDPTTTSQRHSQKSIHEIPIATRSKVAKEGYSIEPTTGWHSIRDIQETRSYYLAS